jgi:hypothetical protein
MNAKSALSPSDLEILHKMIQDHNVLQNNEQIAYKQRKYSGIITSLDFYLW